MRISSINSNVKFGQIERTTAEMLLEKENLVLNSQQSPFTAAGDILDFYFKNKL